MTVVINDFEVVTEPPRSEPTSVPAQQTKPTPTTTHELECMLRLQQERAERVRAH